MDILRALELAGVLATIVFNAGGFVWLTRNHLRHLREGQESLGRKQDTLQDTMEGIGERVSFIEGHLNLEPRIRRR